MADSFRPVLRRSGRAENGALENAIQEQFDAVGKHIDTLPYAPENRAHWTAPQPRSLAEAIDRLAEAVSGLLGGPIP